eukprot:Phypoly_transcript_29561.p1 GENE.Phypoly_transcript_29561~~Phypoly_transcript_29561.p1  ORF type:complete len:104 (+),score=8.41 Phypoly_transcript_29561:83-394(+)
MEKPATIPSQFVRYYHTTHSVSNPLYAPELVRTAIAKEVDRIEETGEKLWDSGEVDAAVDLNYSIMRLRDAYFRKQVRPFRDKHYSFESILEELQTKKTSKGE